jgi:hypothetical protein
VEGNLERALSEEPRPGAERKLTGKEEALTACASPPEGRARWTLELLAGAMVIGIAASSLRHSMRTGYMQPLLREIGRLRQLKYDPNCEMAHRQERLSLVALNAWPPVGWGAPRGLESGCAMKLN